MRNRFSLFLRPLFLLIFFMMGLGLVQVYSTSTLYAGETLNQPHAFFFKQSVFVVIAFFVLVATSMIPGKWLQDWGWMAWPFFSVLVLATLIPGLGISVGGAARWLPTPFGWRFEPSEFLRISMVLLMASFFTLRHSSLGRLPWWAHFALWLVPFALLLKQPDFGSVVILFITATAVLFAFGLKRRVLVGGAFVAIPLFLFLLFQEKYRVQRIQAFLDPWRDPEQKGFQVIQSLLSFSNGKLSGVGLGASQGKLFFLPEAHTDFTLAVFGEEWGFWGFSVLMALYLSLIFQGLKIASNAQEKFDRVLATGLTLLFAITVFVNVGVVLGLLPTKGLTLPFLSYGGSSLVATAALFGLLLGIERRSLNKTSR